ncbi:MAG: hypothetical protein Q7U20_07830 [Caulobacter sp.]|nr:hypothetical protein [Caulobacter sp.]
MRSIDTEYKNQTILSLRELVGEPFSCFTSRVGLPPEVLQDFRQPPDPRPVYVRLMAFPAPGMGRKLHSFLQDGMAFHKGEDYSCHPNGLRGGARYFDIYRPDAIDKLEQKARDAAQGASFSTDQRHAPDSTKGAQMKG